MLRYLLAAVGVVQLIDSTLATPNTTSDSLAVVPAYLDKFYLQSNFSDLTDVDDA